MPASTACQSAPQSVLLRTPVPDVPAYTVPGTLGSTVRAKTNGFTIPGAVPGDQEAPPFEVKERPEPSVAAYTIPEPQPSATCWMACVPGPLSIGFQVAPLFTLL